MACQSISCSLCLSRYTHKAGGVSLPTNGILRTILLENYKPQWILINTHAFTCPRRALSDCGNKDVFSFCKNKQEKKKKNLSRHVFIRAKRRDCCFRGGAHNESNTIFILHRTCRAGAYFPARSINSTTMLENYQTLQLRLIMN